MPFALNCFISNLMDLLQILSKTIRKRNHFYDLMGVYQRRSPPPYTFYLFFEMLAYFWNCFLISDIFFRSNWLRYCTYSYIVRVIGNFYGCDNPEDSQRYCRKDSISTVVLLDKVVIISEMSERLRSNGWFERTNDLGRMKV